MRKIILTIIVCLLFSPEIWAKKDWKEYKSRHFIIYYDEAPMVFVLEVEDAAEHYYDKITRDLGFSRDSNWSFDERAIIYIYKDQDDFARNWRNVGWAHGIAQVRKKTIRTFPMASGFFDTTLPHELAHIIFREFVGFDIRMPLWFEEGVAMFQERAKRLGAHKDVKLAIEANNFIPLDQLSHIRLNQNETKEDIELFYAESASIVNFMIVELGENRFRRMCRKLKKRGSFEWALVSSYTRFDSIEELNKSWVSFLKDF